MLSPQKSKIWLPLVGAAVVAGGLFVHARGGPADPPGAQHAASSAPRTGHPNVVLLIIDTLRADHLGCYGHPADPSPELDAMAAAGLQVESVVAPTTWTRPSIGAMVTGLHPRSFGIYSEDRHALPDHVTTLAEAFSGAGYTTLGITANPNINPYYGFDQGFDWYRGTDQLFDWMPADAVGISEAEANKRRRRGRHLPSAREVLDTLTARLDDHPTGPWYVQINLMDVHEFSVDSLELPADVASMYPDAPSRNARRYLQAVTAVSRQVDRFARQLYDRPGWEDTLLVVTSDHGETFDETEHPSIEDPKWHGHLVYESQALVPLLMYNPRDPTLQGTLAGPVGLIDLAPTILQYAGIKRPEPVDGRDMRAESGTEVPHYVVETRFRGVDKIALYAPKWHYIHNRDDHPGAPAEELQPAGTSENGRFTSQAAERTRERGALADQLAEWERAHPPAAPSWAEGPVPDAIQDQLEAIGYIE